MKHKKIWMAVGICLLSVGGVTGIWALNAGPEASVTNRLHTSVVDITLENYKEVDGKETPFTEEDREIMVMPGMQVSQIPKITNKAEDCYIRAGIALGSRMEVERPLTLDDISGFSEDWVRQGDYYYYKEILKKGETVPLFDTITIPAEWDTRYGEEGIEDYYTLNSWDVTVRVDAIQERNLTPDFASGTPWGAEGKDFAVQECIQEDGYELTAYEKNGPPKFQVAYQGDSGKLIAAPEDFFEGLGLLVPGDTCTGAFTMKNDGERSRTFYFKTEILEEKELLEEITLKIWSGSTVIYEGPLNSRSLNSYVDICSLKKGQEQDVGFSVSVPKELDNQYTLSDCKVKWLFKTVEEPEKARPVRTGDGTEDAVIWALAGAAAVLMAVETLRRKRRRKP